MFLEFVVYLILGLWNMSVKDIYFEQILNFNEFCL